MFLLDTNVVSELRRTRPHGAVVAWLMATPNNAICLSAVTVGEIQAGVEKVRHHDPAKAQEIENWLVETVLEMNVISPDAETFRVWARLMFSRQGHLWRDAMIAATAIGIGATVVTRNTDDFRTLGVPTLDPFRT